MHKLGLVFIFFFTLTTVSYSLLKSSFYIASKTRLRKSCVRSNAVSAAQQFAQQKQQLAQQLREEEAQRKYHSHLDLIADGDDEACKKLSCKEKWLKLAAPGMTITEEGLKMTPLDDDRRQILTPEYYKRTNETLDLRGFAMFPSEIFEWEKHGVDFTAIAKTMETLCQEGWPPVFIFLYDQPWKMCYRCNVLYD